MIEINFLRDTSESDEYLKKIFLEIESTLSIKEKASSNLYKGPLVIEMSESNVKSVMVLIEDRSEQVIIAFKNKPAFKLLSHLKEQFDKIYGFIDLSLDHEYNIPIFKNYLNQNYSKSIVGLEKLNKDLTKILEHTRTELSHVKEMHDRFIKLRTEVLRAGKVQIKFMAGEKSGGEFFDFIETDHEIIIVQVGSDSYVTSSMIISEVEILKSKVKNVKDDVQKFLKDIVFHANEMKSKVNYLITVLNLNNLEINYYQRGNSKLYVGSEVLNISGEGKIRLSRGEKFFFISEGIIRNWNLNNKESELKDFLNKNIEMNTKDFINELFFELARHKNSPFLLFDALMCAIEINQNVIHEV